MTSAEIKDQVSMTDVCHHYGLTIRKGFIHCPFHGGDKTPSLKIYPNGTWHCFACNASGDIFTFIMRMENKSFKEVFSMLGGTSDKNFISTWKVEKTKRDTEEDYNKAQLRFYSNALRNVEALIKKLPPYSDDWVKAVNLEPVIEGEYEHYFDLLYGKKDKYKHT